MIIWLFTAFFLKHFIVDFPLQVAFMYKNKGTLWHPGGLLHARQHGIGTALVLTLFEFLSSGTFSPFLILGLGLLDFVIHYFIDFAKMNLNRIKGWGPTTHEEFWWLLGLDQLLHYLTYAGIIAIWIGFN